MFPFIPHGLLPIILAAGLAIGSFAAGWGANGWRLGKQIATMKAQAAVDLAVREKTAREEVEKARAREAAVSSIAEGIVQDARKILDDVQRDAAAADAARVGLLDAARRAAARRCPAASTAGAAGGGASGLVPGGMQDGDRLLFVLAAADGRAGELAAAADRARTAGAACERLYDAARAETLK